MSWWATNPKLWNRSLQQKVLLYVAWYAVCFHWLLRLWIKSSMCFFFLPWQNIVVFYLNYQIVFPNSLWQNHSSQLKMVFKPETHSSKITTFSETSYDFLVSLFCHLNKCLSFPIPWMPEKWCTSETWDWTAIIL